jgi:hypothetical protein
VNSDRDAVPTDDAVADVMRVALTRAVADEASGSIEWTSVVSRARRVVLVRRALAAVACVIVVMGVAAVAFAATTSNDRRGVSVIDAPRTTTTTRAASDTASRERAAMALANRMLGDVRVPAGAQPSEMSPPSVLHGPVILPRVTGNLVDAHRLWTVPDAPKSVASFAGAHVPVGFITDGNGSETDQGVKALLVDQALAVLPANMFSAELHWAVTDAGNGGSVLRVDAVVGWFARQPPGKPRTPASRVAVASGCPRTIKGSRDVDNPVGERGPLLLPSLAPTAALVCAYGTGGPLTGQRLLGIAQAQSLATVINRLDLKPDIGIHSCPEDADSIDILALSFRDRADVDLRWHASGCQSLDNGYIGAGETANPSFYNGFIGFMQHLRG